MLGWRGRIPDAPELSRFVTRSVSTSFAPGADSHSYASPPDVRIDQVHALAKAAALGSVVDRLLASRTIEPSILMRVVYNPKTDTLTVTLKEHVLVAETRP
jgi:hypothetical protein